MLINALDFWGLTFMVLAQTVLSLILFSAGIAILVFLLRRPLLKYKPVDLAVFESLKPRIRPWKNRAMLFVCFLGNHRFLVPANLLLIGYFLFVRHQNFYSLRMLTIALSSLVLMLLLKAIFRRRRPLSPLIKAVKGLSFPSGHAIMAVTFYGLLIYFVSLELAPGWIKSLLVFVLVLIIVLIGYSRIYLRVHYASDVLAGFIIGIVWLLISLAVLERVEMVARQAVF